MMLILLNFLQTNQPPILYLSINRVPNDEKNHNYLAITFLNNTLI